MNFEIDSEKIKNPRIDVPPKPSIQIPLIQKVPQDFIIGSASESFHRGPVRRQGFKLIAWSWLAAGIDFALIIAMSLIFTSCFLLVFKMNFAQGLEHDQGLSSSFALMAAFLAVFYMIFVRSFLGFSLGDWACGLRLGSALERHSKYYTLRVLARTLLIAGTGFVILPAIALITGRDIAGQISRVRLVSLN